MEAGKYIGAATGLLTGATTCPINQYCPPGSSAPINCPTGTGTASTGMGELLNCGPCPAGTACPTAGTSVACSAGYYCPAGTKNPTDYPCPPGTFTSSTAATASSDCTDCPAGKACAEASTVGTLDCAAGHYCPLRTEYPTQFPCPAGTYSANINNFASTDCTSCPAGQWCDIGSVDSTVLCPKNFKCPLGATSPVPCPAGKYSAAGASVCTSCAAGYI